MGKGLRLFLLGAALAAAVAGCYEIMLLRSIHHDDFAFLGGRRPQITGIIPTMTSSWSPSFGSQYRIYSWKQDYREVLAKATQELKDRGYKLTYKGDDEAVFVKSPGSGVQIGPGRSRNRREGLEGKRTHDFDWITVAACDPAEDTWLNHLRYGLEPGY